MKYSKQQLIDMDVCEEAIDFCERNGLLDNEITLSGDHAYARWTPPRTIYGFDGQLAEVGSDIYCYYTYGTLNYTHNVDDGTLVKYDSAGRPVKHTRNSRETLYEYDKAGNLVYIKHASGTHTRHEYNEQGQKTRSASTLGPVYLWTYDDAGRVATLSVGINKYRYEYASGACFIIGKDGICSEHRDAFGNLVRTKDYAGEVTLYHSKYDSEGRVVFYNGLEISYED